MRWPRHRELLFIPCDAKMVIAFGELVLCRWSMHIFTIDNSVYVCDRLRRLSFFLRCEEFFTGPHLH